MFETPILLIIFKRKDTALKVLEIIKRVKPKYLYIAADGWRDENEKIKCLETREAILKTIDFECNLKTLFREKNLGCCDGVAGAIQWFFENVEQGIILEDDCLAEISFFDYCEKLLNYYKDNERIMHIAGDSPLDREADFEIAIKRFGLIPFSLTHNASREVKRIIRQIGNLFKSRN